MRWMWLVMLYAAGATAQVAQLAPVNEGSTSQLNVTTIDIDGQPVIPLRVTVTIENLARTKQFYNEKIANPGTPSSVFTLEPDVNVIDDTSASQETHIITVIANVPAGCIIGSTTNPCRAITGSGSYVVMGQNVTIGGSPKWPTPRPTVAR